MNVEIDEYTELAGFHVPARFRIGNRAVEAAGLVDQWYGSDYRYVMLTDCQGNGYLLRLDETRAAWELTMYRTRRARSLSVSLSPHKPARWRHGTPV